jgi:hypothetical protein
MIEQIYAYFSIATIYQWVNLGVLPIWCLIIFFPQSQLCRYLATSIIPVFLLGAVYCFVLYKSYLNSYDFIRNFNLYLGINYTSNLFDDNSYLLLFWIHFVSINLFTGGWVLKDSQKFLMNKFILAFPLIIIYLIGPIGLFLYWLIRIFYAKKFDLYG